MKEDDCNESSRVNSRIGSTEEIYQSCFYLCSLSGSSGRNDAERVFGFSSWLQTIFTGLTTESIISALGLEKAVNKQIRYYSSGMKQRVKLAQCIFSDTAIVLLDEPCTNLDAAGMELYNQLINDYCKKRMVIVSSNDHHEYEFCTEKINIMNWK